MLGDIVLVKEGNLSSGKLAHVVITHRGLSILVRTVKFEISDEEYKRPVVKLSPLLFSVENEHFRNC
jgi:hypothetical protein